MNGTSAISAAARKLAVIISKKVDPSNDVVFTSQFAIAAIPSTWMYGYLGQRMRFLKIWTWMRGEELREH